MMKNRVQNWIQATFAACPGRMILLCVSGFLVILQRALRGNRALMRMLSLRVVQPVHRFLAVQTGKLPFSLAEVLILLAGTALLMFTASTLWKLVFRPERLKTLGRYLLTVASAGLAVYAGFCLLWGVFYYGDDFMERAGFKMREITVSELEEVTVYFAGLANRYSSEVPRDSGGVCATDRKAVLEKSRTLYRAAEKACPELKGPAVAAKPFFFSKLLSLTDFTGFFFPFTAEANVNTDAPASEFAATVAHELAHQRGVAREQEANFFAVYASLLDGDPDYCYSASLMAYTYLGNALYSASPSAWEAVFQSLNEDVLRDLEVTRSYWKQYETPVQTVSNTVYEGFLYSYDQTLGLKSYGACVDLLVCQYLAQSRTQPAG